MWYRSWGQVNLVSLAVIPKRVLHDFDTSDHQGICTVRNGPRGSQLIGPPLWYHLLC